MLTTNRTYLFTCLVLLGALPVWAQVPPAATSGESTAMAMASSLGSEGGARAEDKTNQEESLYDQGTEAMDSNQWDRALDAFKQVAAMNGPHADGALYWGAFIMNKQGKRAEALEVLAKLQKSYPKSRWLNDAKALELEIRQSSGRPVSPESESNDDLKLLAINGLMNSDPDRAIPLLEKILAGNQSPKVKERALFVLAQSDSPRARQAMVQMAQGTSNPELQRQAVRFLAQFGDESSRQELQKIYASTSNAEIKRAILQGYMISGSRALLLAAAKSEKDPELRKDAIRQLALTGAENELWQLYQNETSADVKSQILQSLFLTGKADKLLAVARNEPNPALRRAAVRSLGLLGADKAGAALADIYRNDKDLEVRKEVLNALFIQGNAKGLVAIARAEQNRELKEQAIQKLSLMNSQDATDYMLEILNK
jgi:HEAT repeat protein